jgi:hypothetical protein
MLEAIRQNRPGVQVPVELFGNYLKIQKQQPSGLLVRLKYALKEGVRCARILKSYDKMIVEKTRGL